MSGALFSPRYFSSVAPKHLQTKCWSVKLKGILLAQWMSSLLCLCSRKMWQELNLKIWAYCPLRASWAEIQANLDQGHCEVWDEWESSYWCLSVQQDHCATATEQTGALAVPTGVWGAAPTPDISTQEARSVTSPDVPASTRCSASLRWDPRWTSSNQTLWGCHSRDTLTREQAEHAVAHDLCEKRGPLTQAAYSSAAGRAMGRDISVLHRPTRLTEVWVNAEVISRWTDVWDLVCARVYFQCLHPSPA